MSSTAGPWRTRWRRICRPLPMGWAPPATGRSYAGGCTPSVPISCTGSRNGTWATAPQTGSARRGRISACSLALRGLPTRNGDEYARQLAPIRFGPVGLRGCGRRHDPGGLPRNRGVGPRDRAERGSRPFMLCVGYLLPHCPFVARREDYDAFAGTALPDPLRRSAQESPWITAWRSGAGLDEPDPAAVHRARIAYYGLVRALDAKIGKVLEALEAAGLTKDTLDHLCLRSRRASRRPWPVVEEYLLRGVRLSAARHILAGTCA